MGKPLQDPEQGEGHFRDDARRGPGRDPRRLPELEAPLRRLDGDPLRGRDTEDVHRLADAGRIAAPYSAHDFRHFYAVAEYRKDQDLHRVSKLLGHASIQVTETYLHGLGEVD